MTDSEERISVVIASLVEFLGDIIVNTAEIKEGKSVSEDGKDYSHNILQFCLLTSILA